MDHLKPFQGSCLCGAVRYEVDEISPRMAHCHCSMCRRFHGSAFATFGEAKRAHFRWLQGEDLLSAFQADNGTVRRFCGCCGSSMTFAPANDDGALVQFSLGTLVSELDMKPDAHIFIGSKASWVEPCDGLPQFVEGRDSARVDE